MLQSQVSAVALIFLLGSMLTVVDAKAISKRHVRRDWLIIPDTIALYVYDSLNKTSPKAAEFLVEAVKVLPILEIRNFLIEKTAKISVLAEQLAEKASGLWKEVNEPAQR